MGSYEVARFCIGWTWFVMENFDHFIPIVPAQVVENLSAHIISFSEDQSSRGCFTYLVVRECSTACSGMHARRQGQAGARSIRCVCYPGCVCGRSFCGASQASMKQHCTSLSEKSLLERACLCVPYGTSSYLSKVQRTGTTRFTGCYREFIF